MQPPGNKHQNPHLARIPQATRPTPESIHQYQAEQEAILKRTRDSQCRDPLAVGVLRLPPRRLSNPSAGKRPA